MLVHVGSNIQREPMLKMSYLAVVVGLSLRS